MLEKEEVADKIEHKVESLQNHPRLGKKVKKIDVGRSLLIRNYKIVYTIQY